jgi:hypothetical protein
MGCPPMDKVLMSRDIQEVVAGYEADKSSERLLSTNSEVDDFAGLVISTMEENGFYLSYSSTSWGLQPLTGHTQNLAFKTSSNDYVSCSVTISKTEFSASFMEYERKSESNEYLTSEEDKAGIDRAAKALDTLAKGKFVGRSVRVSIYRN